MQIEHTIWLMNFFHLLCCSNNSPSKHALCGGGTSATAAGFSAASSRRKLVELLIRKGAPLSERNKRLDTPLHLAADHALIDVIDLLARKLHSNIKKTCLNWLIHSRIRAIII